MTFDNDFKEALKNLPPKEKDKLLLRLLKKDMYLAHRLYFELVDARTVDDRRLECEEKILKLVENITRYRISAGYLMMYMRDMSGVINNHVRITRDKFGEVYLNVFMLNESLKKNNTLITEESYERALKCCRYIIARAFKILILRSKLHEDLLLDLNHGLESLGYLISENHYLKHTAERMGFDLNWLLQLEIPENIAEIHKELKANYY